MTADHIARLKAIRWEKPDYIPTNVYILSAAWMKHREAMQEIVDRHPALFENQPKKSDYDEVFGTYVQGNHTDAWGCVWHNVHHGMEAIVKEHPLPTREMVRTLKAPSVDIGCPHGFMYLRLGDLRGFEEIMVDFAEEPQELQMLLDIVSDYNLRQTSNIAVNLPDCDDTQIVAFGDDLGMQTSLPMSPEKWRKYLKPCYDKIYKPLRDKGANIFMHTDGHIYEIIPDLVDVGVKVVNPQIRANGLDNLVRVCKGKVCVALDLDRQLFPFCSPQDIDEHVRECVEKLGSPEGGLWLVAEISEDIPLENVEAIFAAVEKYRLYYS